MPQQLGMKVQHGARLVGARVPAHATRGAVRSYASAAVLRDPPYSYDALEPHMSRETLEYHHGKHQNTYVNNLAGLIEKDPSLENKSLEEIMKEAYNGGNYGGLYNNAAQVFNHELFWLCMSPNGGGEPQGKIREEIEKNFGSIDQFKEQWKAAAAPGAAFGSGWVWLVRKNDNSLAIEFHLNAENPTSKGTGKELMGEDVWEHAYYVDFRNARASYTNTFLESLVNWQYAEDRFLDKA